MATRTAINITVRSPYQAATALTGTSDVIGDGFSLDLTRAPQLVLLVCNSSTAHTVTFTVEYPAAKSSFGQAISREHEVPVAAGTGLGFDGKRAIVLDIPADLEQSGGVLHIDSTDGNFADLTFYGVAWTRTPCTGAY